LSINEFPLLPEGDTFFSSLKLDPKAYSYFAGGATDYCTYCCYGYAVVDFLATLCLACGAG